MLIDQAKIYVKGGAGGKGCNSLFKDMFNRRGIPDGADGGPGGDVVIESDANLQTLLDFKYNQHYEASDGKHGGSNDKSGRRGKDRVVKVPAGTIVRDSSNGLVMRDLDRPGERVIVVRGGAGGRGSKRSKIVTQGEPGEERAVLLELKLIADAGVIGFPNAGKSTIVSRISKAHTKIAPYPFTTKSPKLGLVRCGDGSFVVADMPGLIEGAHAGRGLGDRFLRHIERNVVLVHVVDMAPMDGSSAADNYFKLEEELRLYSAEVYAKPRLIVASKMDLPGSSEALPGFSEKIKKEVIPVSAVRGDGIKEMVNAIYGMIKNVKEKFEEDNGQDRDESTYE